MKTTIEHGTELMKKGAFDKKKKAVAKKMNPTDNRRSVNKAHKKFVKEFGG